MVRDGPTALDDQGRVFSREIGCSGAGLGSSRDLPSDLGNVYPCNGCCVLWYEPTLCPLVTGRGWRHACECGWWATRVSVHDLLHAVPPSNALSHWSGSVAAPAP